MDEWTDGWIWIDGWIDRSINGPYNILDLNITEKDDDQSMRN